MRDKEFIEAVWAHYQAHGRSRLPWRKTTRPYHILVSEVMCQQTQVDRVVPKYRAFLGQFPSMRALANAPLGDVLRAWQGLGYNRRAKLLHACARTLVQRNRGRLPREPKALMQLPGIGPYTAGAVSVFAYNRPVPLIETNVRTAYLHHFFPTHTHVAEQAILNVVERTMDMAEPRAWFSALMDYGAFIKRTFGNQNHRSVSYVKQSAFAGSDREIRGAILRSLSERTHSSDALRESLSFPRTRLEVQLQRLCAEGLIEKGAHGYRLPE